MKILLSAVVILVLMIGAPSVYALTDTQKEAGIASDSQGRVCNYGPSHDQCHDQFLERIRNSSDYQSGVKHGDYQSGFKHGVADAKINTTGSSIPLYYIHQPGKGFAFHTTAFVDGYIHGWCSVNGPGSGIDVNDEPEPTIVAFDCNKGLISVTPDPRDWPSASWVSEK